MHPIGPVRQLHAGDRVRIRDERWQIAGVAPHGAVAVLDVRGCDVSNRGETACFLLPYEAVDRLARWPAPRVVRPGRWRHAARRALAEASASWAAIQAATRARIEILPFQLEPLLALLRGDGCRFLIADAVGMGKTIQAGLMVAESRCRQPDSRVLIVTPAGLREQWRDELRDRFGLDAVVLDASGVASTQSRIPPDVNPWSVHPLAVTSIDYVKRPEVIRCHEPLLWDMVIFDEAHALTGRSDRAAAADALGRRARTVVLLTATPHSGDEDGFRRLCSLGQLQTDPPLLLFRRSKPETGLRASRRTVMRRITPTPAETAMHAALFEYARLVWSQTATDAAAGARLAMSVLMRRASSSAAALARSLERRLALLGTPSVAALQGSLPFGDGSDDVEPDAVLGAPGLADSRDERTRLERVLALARQARVGESKLAALRRFLARAGEPAIVFTEYRDTLEQVAASLAPAGAVQLHGGLTPRERADVLGQFVRGSARLLLATDAASEGLNLHHRCRLVINLELPWTPLRLEQRAGRVDRIGQTRRVHALHLVAAGTSEEHVLAKLAARLTRIDDALTTLGRLPDERDVAECVLANGAFPEAVSQRVSPPVDGVRVPDLGGDAKEEAARILTARALGEPLQDGAEARPVLTRLRRPGRARSRLECYWLFRLLLTASDGRIGFTACVPLGATGIAWLARSNAATRLLLDPGASAVGELARMAAEAAAGALTDASRTHLRMRMDRERALGAELRDRQARLSSRLLQPGLFDHRHERAAAAQACLLERALTASGVRMAQLAAAEPLRVDACDLVFAVALE